MFQLIYVRFCDVGRFRERQESLVDFYIVFRHRSRQEGDESKVRVVKGHVSNDHLGEGVLLMLSLHQSFLKLNCLFHLCDRVALQEFELIIDCDLFDNFPELHQNQFKVGLLAHLCYPFKNFEPNLKRYLDVH